MRPGTVAVEVTAWSCNNTSANASIQERVLMDPMRFDRFAMAVSARFSRRTALQVGGAVGQSRGHGMHRSRSVALVMRR
jgi:hypothetical protein